MPSAATAGKVIVFVNNSRETFTPTRSGAIATCIWEICRSAQREGVTPWVISRDLDAPPYPWDRLIFVPQLAVEGRLRSRIGRIRRRLHGWARHDQRAYARLVLGRLRNLTPDVAIVNNDPELAVYLARKLPRTDVLHWFHNLEVASDRFRRRIAVNPGLRLVAVSDYLARAVEGVYGLGFGRVSTARNGVDATRFRVRGHEATVVAGSRKPLVGFIGRIAVEKGVDVLLEACAELAKERTDFRVQLAGDSNWGFSDGGPYIQKVTMLAAQLRERGIDVTRLGHVARADVPQALADVDIHVVPSRWDEPCSLVLLEAMASGRAVVATASGGTPELLGGVGRLIPRDDSAALAQTIAELLDDPSERERLGQLAGDRADELKWDGTWRALREAAGLA